MIQEELDLEEILLAYLRSSKKIKLAKLSVDKNESKHSYQIHFEVDPDFPGNLTNQIHNPFKEIKL